MPSILIVGDWAYAHYERSLARGFVHHGWQVEKLVLARDVHAGSALAWRLKLPSVVAHCERLLLDKWAAAQPALLFLYRVNCIGPACLEAIRAAGTQVFVYHNDNPYVGVRSRCRDRWFLRSLRAADVSYVYRPANRAQAGGRGARRVRLLGPYVEHELCADPSAAPVQQRYDVVYVGHYEPDGREQVMQSVLARGYSLLLGGARSSWGRRIAPFEANLVSEVKEYFGRDYARVLSAARIGVAFLSGRNRDVYTRRCFEMPAYGVPCLMPGTRELRAIYGDLPCFYASYQDITPMLVHYLEHAAARRELWLAQYPIAARFDSRAAAGRILRHYLALKENTTC